MMRILLSVVMLFLGILAGRPIEASALPIERARGATTCVDDTWTATTATNAPSARYGHTAVWTRSEMIVWGGGPNTGGRYDPATDTWAAISADGAPSARSLHTAVWTGAEMIVWGGGDGLFFLNSGGRYDPTSDSWTPTNTVGAPVGRYNHTALWTGTEMIVWGGLGPGFVALNSGGRYDPATDTWTPTSTDGAPTARHGHTAVWNGTTMIVWGGLVNEGGHVTYFNSGGLYDPTHESWTPTDTANAPSGRNFHTAVWMGTEMIVWGGAYYDVGYHPLNTGGHYDPASNAWTATATYNAPDPRYLHTAVWTGTEMIVWGGESGGASCLVDPLRSGGRYNPLKETWAATSEVAVSRGRSLHAAVWTDTEMIVWGGINAWVPDGEGGCEPASTPTGDRYCASGGSRESERRER